ncbi:MAG: YceH family protein [Pyrinomonadaceae bacterium]
MILELNEVEARIVGCLIEKELTTPEYYPLTLNALVNACNQKSNRNPVVNYDEQTVEASLDALLKRDIVYLFYGAGSRTKKYKHLLPNLLELDEAETALLCVLLLRGAQTHGEINQRTGRMYEFDGLDEIDKTITALEKREEPLVVTLPRQPGQKEGRVMHLLSGEIDFENFDFSQPSGRVNGANAELENRIAALEASVTSLKEEFAEFKKQFE